MSGGPEPAVVVGLDVGGTKVNATVLATDGTFLINDMVESPSRVLEGPEAALSTLSQLLDGVLAMTAFSRASVAAVGLDTPGPASAEGVLSSKGSTNFSQPVWRGYDFRGALQARLQLPVVYINDGNAASLYAHQVCFGADAARHSSVAAVVGTGLGGGVIDLGRVVSGAAGMAGEFGHVVIPMEDILGPEQPVPVCNCGQAGDVESVASLTGIERNLLPYWLGRYPNHQLASAPRDQAAKAVRTFGEQGDSLARSIFEQQAKALGKLFGIVANVLDPGAYFVGGGVVETGPEFRAWFLDAVRGHTALRDEQRQEVVFDVVPSLDMAGARGAALAALASLKSH